MSVQRRRMDDLREATREFYRRALAARDWSAYRLAQEAGVSSTTITRPLNNLDYKFTPRLDTLMKVSRASGVELPEILRVLDAAETTPVSQSIPVVGDVQAGAWRRIPDEPVIEESLPMNVREYEGASLFALRVVGRSMDEIYPDGTYVICVPPAEAGLRIGDMVVVRQSDATGRCETTLKELTRARDGSLWLEPRSSDKSLKPLPLAVRPDADMGIDVIGIVVSTYAKQERGKGPILQL